MNISLFHLCLEAAQWLLIVALLLILLRRKFHAKPSKETVAVDKVDYNESVNSISILGGFCVRNRDGEDISSRFSPIIRKVLVALVLHSVDDKQGLLGEKMDSFIWSYKPEGTASNNRNVYLSRLRKALESVDGVSISTKNQLTRISVSPEAYCDYMEIIRLYKTGTSSVNVERLLYLLQNGHSFADINDEWLKDFYSDFSTKTVSFLSQLLSREDLSSSLRQKVSDTITCYDKLKIS